jgi:hypothetical protein
VLLVGLGDDPQSVGSRRFEHERVDPRPVEPWGSRSVEVEDDRHRGMDPQRPHAGGIGKVEHEGLESSQLVHEHHAEVRQNAVVDVERSRIAAINEFSHIHNVEREGGLTK